MRRIRVVLSAVLGASLLTFVPVTVVKAVVATSYDAQRIGVESIARAGGNAEFSVTTWLPNNETSTADSVFVYDYDNNKKILAVSSSATIVTINGQSFANYRLTMPVSAFSNTLWTETVSTPNGNVQETYFDAYVGVTNLVPPSVNSYLSDWGSYSSANSYSSTYTYTVLAGTPVSAVFGPGTPDTFQSAINPQASTYTLELTDGNGQPTIMLPGQSMTITPSGGLSLQVTKSSSTFTTGAQTASLSSSDLKNFSK